MIIQPKTRELARKHYADASAALERSGPVWNADQVLRRQTDCQEAIAHALLGLLAVQADLGEPG